MKTLMTALAASVAFAASAQAQNVAALIGDNTIAIVDVKAMSAAKPMTVSGIGGSILGIDVRPADGALYALISDGSVVTIDPSTGKATQKSKLDKMLTAGVAATVDFNPVADRLRVIGSDGTNLRVNVDDGKVTADGSLKYADGDMHKGEKPNIVAGAYTNSVKGAKETTLYDIDATIGALIKQAPPNDGVLNAVGKLGTDIKGYAFDIVADGSVNTGWLMTGDTLYKVDLATAKATPAGKVSGLSGAVRDIAAMPAT